MQQELRRSVRERLPNRYLELEERRLISLIGEWLEYELTRVDFTVLKTEDEHTVTLGGLTFDLRLDRVDQLSNGNLLVIDYKTGLVNTKAWDLPRPDDVQLPLYATFALEQNQILGGLAFAQVRRGNSLGFAGHTDEARENLITSLRGTSSLVKNKLNQRTLDDWKRYIESLARDFLSGRADVDPREYPKTCTRCGLQSLCRIQENRVSIADDAAEIGEEVGDE
jgi:ATP-dependent helicase/DNAse subunit B